MALGAWLQCPFAVGPPAAIHTGTSSQPFQPNRMPRPQCHNGPCKLHRVFSGEVSERIELVIAKIFEEYAVELVLERVTAFTTPPDGRHSGIRLSAILRIGQKLTELVSSLSFYSPTLAGIIVSGSRCSLIAADIFAGLPWISASSKPAWRFTDCFRFSPAECRLMLTNA